MAYLSVDPVIRTDLLNFRQVTGPVIKTMHPNMYLSSVQVYNLTYWLLTANILCVQVGLVWHYGCFLSTYASIKGPFHYYLLFIYIYLLHILYLPISTIK